LTKIPLKEIFPGSKIQDWIFVGFSCLNLDNFNEVILSVQSIAGSIPGVIFPGFQLQLISEADAILFL
jgi:heptaprenylglyceryl phosphate synthase